MAKLYGRAVDVGGEIVEKFKNPSSLPAPLATIFIRRKDASPCRAWSWGNQLIVAMHGFSEARGFRQWQEVGRHVKKGEKACYILAPLVKKVEREDDNGDQKEHTALYGFRSVPVFGLEQTDGDPLPVDEHLTAWLEGLPLREVAESWGLEIQAFNGGAGGTLGYISPSTNTIALGVENLSTWAHEIIHAADARNVGPLKTGQHVDQETVAQLGSAILLTLLGKPVEADLGHCWRYIESYVARTGKATVDVCLELLNRTCKAVDLILTTAESLAGTAPGERDCTIANRVA